MSTVKGCEYEDKALKYLQTGQFELIARNFRGHRLGEIDIIGFDNQVLCFIEVKYRRNSFYGDPLELVNLAKQNKIALTAQQFLLNYPQYSQYECRFDVVAILGHSITWLKNAFMIEE